MLDKKGVDFLAPQKPSKGAFSQTPPIATGLSVIARAVLEKPVMQDHQRNELRRESVNGAISPQLFL